MRYWSIVAVLLIFASGSKAAEGVREITVQGEEGYFELFNDSTRVVLSPHKGGRVLNYQLNGSEVIYQGGGLEQPGGRFDIGPAYARGEHTTLWDGAYIAAVTGNRSVRLLSRIDQNTGLQIWRTFTLAESGSHLQVRQMVFNRGKKPMAVFHWSRTFAIGGGIALAPLPPESQSRFPAGYGLGSKHPGHLNLNPKPEKHMSIVDRVLHITGKPSNAKSVFDLSAGWMAYAAPNDLLFLKTFQLYPERVYGDATGHHGSFWYYHDIRVEIEPNSPREILNPGQKSTFIEDWWLYPFEFPEDRQPDLEIIRQRVVESPVS